MATIVVNGIHIDAPDGASVRVINGTVFVDGKKTEGGKNEDGVTKVVWEGPCGPLSADGEIVVKGDVYGNVNGNSVTCNKVTGDVDANVVNCWSIHGNVEANVVKWI
jgi:hypothetical protein